MSAVSGRGGLQELLVLACALLAAAAILSKPAKAADTVTVIVDQARIMKLPERTATIVVGNPLIADVTLQAGGTLIITGKGFGYTNMVILDRGGKILLERSVQVVGPGENVVFVFRGVERESYSCLPDCERRITLGDSPAYFGAVLQQTGTRNGQASGNAAAK
ncbi:MAG: pilus assembly protein N-terminal domain-containing protein [Hyphomicrobiales bacterium]